MTTASFKKGDRVRRTGYSADAYGITKGDVYVVDQTVGHGDITLEGIKGVWYRKNFELAEVAPPPEPTDQELADEYRRNYLRNREIKVIMKARGFTQQYQKPNATLWHDASLQPQPDGIRFHRVVTPAPIITIV